MLGEEMYEYGWTMDEKDIRNCILDIKIYADIKKLDYWDEKKCMPIVEKVKQELRKAQEDKRFVGEIRDGNDMPPPLETQTRCILKELDYTQEEIENIVKMLRRDYKKVDHAMPFIVGFGLLFALFPTFLWFGSDCCWNWEGIFLWWVIIPLPFTALYISTFYRLRKIDNLKYLITEKGPVEIKEEST